MEYPRICNWLTFQKTSDHFYIVYDHLLEEKYTLDPYIAEFAMKLDGKHDPFQIDPSIPRQDVLDIMKDLKELDLIRTSNIVAKGKGMLFYTLWIPKWSASLTRMAAIFSWLLIILCVPAVVIGILLVSRYSSYIDYRGSLIGMLTGLISGAVLHELAHGLTALSCGASVFEFGGLINFYVLPGAYVLMDTDRCSWIQKVWILAAGPVMNLFLTGVFLSLAAINQYDSGIYYTAATINGSLALLNLVFGDGFDGIKIFIQLLGGDGEEFVDEAKKVVKSARRRRYLRNRGIAGHAAIVLSYFMVGSQIIIPVVIIINVLAILGGLS